MLLLHHTFLWSTSSKPMRLYHNMQVTQKSGLRNKRNRAQCWISPIQQVIENQQQEEDDLVKPRKLINPILASIQRRTLHQELLFCHRRGMLPQKKPELQILLDSINRAQLKKRELALQPLSDLEVKLRRRRQNIQLYELEEKKWREGLRNVPEFIRVRQSLKPVLHSS